MTTPDRARRALVVRGGWDGHDPIGTTDLFIPLLEREGFVVRVEESTEVYADAAALAETDLVVQSVTMGSAQPEEIRGLRGAVSAGTGFAGWHGGVVDAFRGDVAYAQLVGGTFVQHPPKHPDQHVGGAVDAFVPHVLETTELGRAHPIMQGVDRIELETEQYWLLSDDYNDVLATTTLPAREWEEWNRPVTAPAVWTRQWGAGRVFVSVVGHDVATLSLPDVRTVTERGILWASR